MTSESHSSAQDAARARLRADAQFPQYHVTPPGNWMNDPNGLIHWQGSYHVFYQYNPHGPFHGTIHWGHAVSDDLAHWRDLPVALAPTPGTPDADGCYSGCAVDDHGVPTFIYSGHNRDNPGGFELPCLATGDEQLLSWASYPGNPLLPAPPPGLDLVAFRDHSVWQEQGLWYMLIGAGIKDVGGTALLFRSPDLRRWEYMHPLCVGDLRQTEPVWTGSMWECPDFFALGDGHVLNLSVWDQEQTLYSVYLSGTLTDHRFTPQHTQRLDLGDSFYAPQSMLDAQGRRLMWGWLREERSTAAQIAAGWSGALTLPRLLTLRRDGTLGMQPAPELALLRGAHSQLAAVDLTPASHQALGDLRGDCIELIAEWAPNQAAQLGLKLRCSPDGAEETLLLYDRARQQLMIDRTRSSLSADATSTPAGGSFALAADEPLRLHVFLDRSAVEVFANERACLSTRIYPSRADSLGLDAFARGGEATLTRLEMWELGAAWTHA